MILGVVLRKDGEAVPTNSKGLPLDEGGSVLPTDSTGTHIIPASTLRPSPYCLVSSHIDLILILDTSSNVKILDYRVMKELIKNFLSEHFNLGRNRVRVGVIKFGDCAEVCFIPVATFVDLHIDSNKTKYDNIKIVNVLYRCLSRWETMDKLANFFHESEKLVE